MAEAKRGAGRPRSEEARHAVLGATQQLLLDGICVRDLTIEQIAQTSGVSRPTIYRWWPNKVVLVIDAFLEAAEPLMQYQRKGPPRAVLKAQLREVMKLARGRAGKIVIEILGEARLDPSVLEIFRERFLDVRRAAMRAFLLKAQETGDIAAGIDVELVIDLILGPIYLRLLLNHLPLDDGFADALVDRVFDGAARS